MVLGRLRMVIINFKIVQIPNSRIVLNCICISSKINSSTQTINAKCKLAGKADFTKPSSGIKGQGCYRDGDANEI